MIAYCMVFFGGGAGALARYGLSLLLPLHNSKFPWSTLLANVIAALVLGGLAQGTLKSHDPHKYLLLATGFCGGLSTFSTFSLESMLLFQRGDIAIGLWNIVLNLALSFWAIWILTHAQSLEQ